MSDTVPSAKPVKIHKLPFVIKKNSIKPCDELNPNYELLFRCVKNTTQNLIKEDIIYKASEHDIFNGKYPNLIIINRLNKLKNTSRTIATYKQDSAIIELTSDAVTKVIGQKNYDIVFSALCSVISQDLKVQGILSLLTLEQKDSPKCVNVGSDCVDSADKASQTDQTSRDIILRDKQRRHIKKKQVRSYPVQDDMLPEKQMKKVIIDPNNYSLISPNQIKVEWEEKPLETAKEDDNNGQNNVTPDNQLPELFLDDDSNISYTSIGSCNIPGILENPKSLLNNIDKHTKEIETDNMTPVKMIDGSLVMIRGKPDIFHMSSPEVLESLSGQDRKRMLLHQAYIDWKFCLQPNEDGNLPIHWAVLNNDVELLKRQCIVLKSRQQSVDITSGGKLTALQLALLNDCAKCTPVLLAHGADPLIPDEEARTPLHLASEVSSENVQAIIEYCRANAREILKDDERLWKEHFERKTDKDLTDYLMYKMCAMCDDQGYTPLMLASRIGNSENVKFLIKAAPGAINMGMPNSGNTALYLAVSEACLDCHSRGNKTTVLTKYIDTIAALVENGADPSIDNNSGSNVNTLLTEFSISQLSMLIANKLTSAKYFDGGKLKNFDSYMLIKDDEGKLNLKELKTTKSVKSDEPKKAVVVNVKNELKQNTTSKTDKPKQDYTKTVIVEQKCNRKKIKKRKPIILQDVPVVTNFVSVARDKPLILKKMKPTSKINSIVDTPKLIKIDTQKLLQFKRLHVNSPIKFVKILPKVNLDSTGSTSSTSSTGSTALISRKKRSKSPSNSVKDSKKTKV